MTSHLEDLSNELLLEIFDYMNPRHIYRAFWNLNVRFDNFLTSINHLQLIVNDEENEEIIACLAPHVRLLKINTWQEIDLLGFRNLHSLILTRPSSTQLNQIRADTMPKLMHLSLFSNRYGLPPKQLVHEVFSNRFPNLRSARLGHIDSFIVLSWSQSLSLRYLHFDCNHSTLIPFILTSCPNLDYLHVDFLRYGEEITLPLSNISNHPLRRCILWDYSRVMSYKDICALITYIPNVKHIELKISCNVPFLTLARYLSDHLHHLHRFNCDITEYPIDSTTNLATIRQIHPCFYHVVCRIQDVDFRIFHT